MGKSAIRHVSVRVPWHDAGWNGTICQDPMANAACLAIRRTAQNRDDEYESENAGAPISELSKLPPCMSERGSFLSPQELKFESRLDYSNYSKDHAHILPQLVHVPAFGGVFTPYKWMLREFAWEMGNDLALEVSEDREPQEGEAPNLIVNTPWVQQCDNQRALLEGFNQLLKPQDSLVFFYARQTPMSDSAARQIVAVAKLEKSFPIDEYPYEGGHASGRIRSMVWERPFQHSLRPDRDNPGFWKGGVVLPYHQLLDKNLEREDLDLESFVATVPDEAYEQFLYGTEHVTHGSAITALQAVRTAVEAASEALPGPWSDYLSWIDNELSQLWVMQGPAPGLGSALSCFDKGFNGTLFAHALAAELDDGEDPWPAVEAIFDGTRSLPESAPKPTTMQKRRFAHFREKQPDEYDLMRLLACFELTKDQALRAFDTDAPLDILANPYLLYEQSRLTEKPISLTTIDRGLYPTDASKHACALPRETALDLEEPDHPLRLRAIAVEALEMAAAEGHTVLTGDRLALRIADLPLSRSVTIDQATLEICEEDFASEIDVIDYDDVLHAQLKRYSLAREVIGSHVRSRLSVTKEFDVDWASLIAKTFDKIQKLDPDDKDEIDARAEKVEALSSLATSQISVLTGLAGTGKTTLLKILLGQSDVVGNDTLLLAPTGKARVRLGQQTDRSSQARTVAQFLLEFGRYDTETGRYIVDVGGPTASVTTCIIDEASMLTEDQLGAICSALPTSARLILVGDPQQLPPIGAGRPFVDIIAYLDDNAPSAVARLTVSRRQSSEGLVPAASLPDVQLASLFSGKELPPGEDEVIASGETPDESERLRFASWDTPSELRDRVLDVLASELGCDEADLDSLENAVELSLGGTANGQYINFNSGCGEKAESWQILSAHRNMASGSSELNRLIKQSVRAKRLATAQKVWQMIEPRGADQITYGDKVICLRNHPRSHWNKENGPRKGYLANGEVGIVNGDFGKGKPRWTKVEFASQKGETFSFERRDFSEEGSPYLELAYAVTVHKAQGSEFGTVILVLPRSSQLLTREMLYTALTRQKNRVWLLHQGPFSHFLKLRSDFFSETARRSTNLFGLPSMRELSIHDVGGSRKGWLAEKLIHATRSDVLVSSKSEVFIADALYREEQTGRLRWTFEKPLIAKGQYRLPDFTIEKNNEVWYWEHCGLMDKPDYVARWKKKLAWYQQQGITVWSKANPDGRLIVTEETQLEPFTSPAADAVVADLLST